MKAKRFLALLLTLCMIIGLFPVSAFATDDVTGEPPAATEPVEGQSEGTSESGSETLMNAPLTSVAETDVAKIGDQGYATLAEAVEAANDGDTITLLKNIAFEVTDESASYYFEIHKNITLDLNGYAVTGGALDVYNEVTIKDSTGSGSITGTKHGIWVNSGAKLTVEGGTIASGTGVAIRVDNGSAEIKGGTIKNENGSYAVYADGASVLTITSQSVLRTGSMAIRRTRLSSATTLVTVK